MEPAKEPGHTVWVYKKAPEPKPEPCEEATTPSLDLKFDVEVEGKTRKAEMSPGGLYVFDKNEKFDVPVDRPLPRHATPPQNRGVWVGVKKPFADGNVLIPMATSFKHVKIGGPIKKILNLTKKTK